MLASTRVKMNDVKKKVNMDTYDIFSIKWVTRKFHLVVVLNNGKQMYKKVCCTCEIVFELIRPIAVFLPFSLHWPLSITGFYILFEQTTKLILSRALLVLLAKSIYYG